MCSNFQYCIIENLINLNTFYTIIILSLILFQAATAGAGGDAEEDEDIDDEGKKLV